MRPAPVKVLFVAGAGRSGSTILDTILGQIDGLHSVGELRYIWERGFLANRPCGCGEPFSQCPFWTEVVEAAFGSPDEVDAARMVALQRSRNRIRHLPRLLRKGRAADPDDHGRAMVELYRAIRDRSGASVIVDSSKLPPYGRQIDLLPGIDLSVLHLVRDPRATAYSWTRKRPLPDRPGQLMQQHRPWKSAALWSVWNWTTDRLWGRSDRYLRLRYEDFAREPQAALQRIVGFLGIEPEGLPFVTETVVDLAPTHTVAGNPSRFRTGRVEIRADEEWLTALDGRSRRAVELIAGPLMRRYGYTRRSNG